MDGSFASLAFETGRCGFGQLLTYWLSAAIWSASTCRSKFCGMLPPQHGIDRLHLFGEMLDLSALAGTDGPRGGAGDPFSG